MANRRPKRSGGHLQAVGHAHSPVAELARLRGEFSAWLTAHGLPQHLDPQHMVDGALSAVGTAVRVTGLAALGRWSPDQILAVAHEPGTDDEARSSLPLLLAFLGDTARWAGTDDELHGCLDAAEEAADRVPEILAALAEVTVPAEEELTAVQALPVISRLVELLRFLSPRRKVTPRGALTKADLPALYQILGQPVPVPLPRSMWDEPELADTVTALVSSGLMQIQPPWATVTAIGQQLLDGEPAISSELAVRQLSALLVARPGMFYLPDPTAGLLPALLAAAVDRPLPVAEVIPAVDRREVEVSMQSLMSGQGGGLTALLTISMQQRYDLLVHQGFLAAGPTVHAPAGLRRVLARSVAAYLRETTDTPGEAPPADPALAGQEWLLRVELEDTDPPVWREIAVDPSITLDELHLTVQALFAWEDYHLHAFTPGGIGVRGIRYAPRSPGDDDFGPPPRDSAAVRLAQLVPPGPTYLTYEYDFGDDWRHRLTVLQRRPATGPLPRCTAGSGAPPVEDSGGPWGWANLIATAHDPAATDHHEVREWLGLEHGQTLDPTAFHPADVEPALAALRT